MKNYIVVIPAYNPMNEFPSYVQDLLDNDVYAVVVINDGSERKYGPVFDQVTKLDRTVVLTHEVNMGKGMGLKTAFKYIMDNHSGIDSVVTADSDGQHLVSDVVNVGETIVKSSVDYILGTRDFTQSGVPFRSRIGNWFTSLIFALFYQYKVRDTQTGLRAFKETQLGQLIDVSGNRFEYEINMLIMIAKKKHSVKNVEITTVYHEDHTSHYSTIRDSVLIGKQMVKGLFISK